MLCPDGIRYFRGRCLELEPDKPETLHYEERIGTT